MHALNTPSQIQGPLEGPADMKQEAEATKQGNLQTTKGLGKINL